MGLKAIVRRWTKVLPTGGRFLRMTNIESLAVAQVEPSLTELSRAGRLFHGGTQLIASGIAPVQTIPSTGATLALYNGENQGGLNYYIQRVGFLLGSGTAAAGASLFMTVSQAAIVTKPSNANNYSSNNSSGANRATKSIWATGITLPNGPNNLTPAWFCVQSNFQLAAANVGQGDSWCVLDGGLCVPPGYAAGFAILSGSGTTPLYSVYAQWAEIENDLET